MHGPTEYKPKRVRAQKPASYRDDNEPPPPLRRLECGYYETCLNIAIALDWASFTCKGCIGQINVEIKELAKAELDKKPELKAVVKI